MEHEAHDAPILSAYERLKDMEPVYADIAAMAAKKRGFVLRCEFMCRNIGNSIKVVNIEYIGVGDNQEKIITARWASHPFAGEIQDFASDITNILDIYSAPNPPKEWRELRDESVTTHEDNAIRHAEKVVQSGRLLFRKRIQYTLQDSLTGIAVTVYSDSLQIWDLHTAAHIKLAERIEQARKESHNV